MRNLAEGGVYRRVGQQQWPRSAGAWAGRGPGDVGTLRRRWFGGGRCGRSRERAGGKGGDDATGGGAGIGGSIAQFRQLFAGVLRCKGASGAVTWLAVMALTASPRKAYFL